MPFAEKDAGKTFSASTETPSQELRRLVKAYKYGERQNRQEAWNLIADFTVSNIMLICEALETTEALDQNRLR